MKLLGDLRPSHELDLHSTDHITASAHAGAVLRPAASAGAAARHPSRSAELPLHAASGGDTAAPGSGTAGGMLRTLLLLVLLVGCHRVWRRYKRWRTARDAERAALQGDCGEDDDEDQGRLPAEERIRRELREANLMRQQRAGGEQAHKALSSLLADSVFADMATDDDPHLLPAPFGGGGGGGLRLPGARARTSPPRGRLYDQHRMRFQQAWPLSEEDSGAVSSDSEAADATGPRRTVVRSPWSKAAERQATPGEQEVSFFGAPAQALDDFEQRVVAHCI